MPTRKDSGYLIPVERIENAILEIRGERVMLDRDLAAVYGVTTKALNQAVKRNRDRFPEGFMFQLTLPERDELVTNCDRLAALKHASSPPYAFTEHGTVMLAAVLNSKRAAEVSVFVVRAFVRMRKMLADQRQLVLKLAELETKLASHDRSLRVVFDAIRSLMQPATPKKRHIGFVTDDDKTGPPGVSAHDRPRRRSQRADR